MVDVSIAVKKGGKIIIFKFFLPITDSHSFIALVNFNPAVFFLLLITNIQRVTG